MRARNLLLTICIGSCLTLACGDDDDAAVASGGTHAEAGAPDEAGKGGNDAKAGSSSSGGDAGKGGSTSGEGGEPDPGMGGHMPDLGVGGGGAHADDSFAEFVHDLVKNQTSDTAQPATTDRAFSEEQDEHQHYLTPAAAFTDLF